MSRLPSAFSKHLKPMGRPQQPGAAPAKLSLEAALRRAEEHLKKGEIKPAEQLCMAVLSKAPDNLDALMLAATLGEAIGDPSLALAFLNRAVAVKPNFLPARLKTANAYLAVSEYESAIEHLNKAFELKPDMTSELGALGLAYTGAGQAEQALAVFEKALKHRPDHPTLRLDYANALISLGRMQEAAQVLRENIARGFQKAASYKSLADTEKFSGDPEELQAIEAELATPGTTANQQMHLHHAAGKILNDVGRFEEAIDHFQKSRTASGFDVDLDAFRRRVDSVIASFTPALLKSKAGLGNPSDVPVFIVGMPRSGTTLTEQICASHPAVFGAGELARLGTVVKTAGYAQGPDNPRDKNPQSLTGSEAKILSADYLEYLKRRAPEAARIVDKMPHNFQYVGMIALLFPNARIIHCTRDPIDNCLSCFFNSFNEDHGYNTDLRKLGLYYREYDRLMRHWHALLPGRIYESRYETMIADQEAESRRLIEFLGLPWDDACLRFYENDRTVTTPSRWQVRQPIYASSVKRWKKYGDKIQPLVDALGDLADV